MDVYLPRPRYAPALLASALGLEPSHGLRIGQPAKLAAGQRRIDPRERLIQVMDQTHALRTEAGWHALGTGAYLAGTDLSRYFHTYGVATIIRGFKKQARFHSAAGQCE